MAETILRKSCKTIFTPLHRANIFTDISYGKFNEIFAKLFVSIFYLIPNFLLELKFWQNASDCGFVAVKVPKNKCWCVLVHYSATTLLIRFCLFLLVLWEKKIGFLILFSYEYISNIGLYRKRNKDESSIGVVYLEKKCVE